MAWIVWTLISIIAVLQCFLLHYVTKLARAQLRAEDNYEQLRKAVQLMAIGLGKIAEKEK